MLIVNDIFITWINGNKKDAYEAISKIGAYEFFRVLPTLIEDHGGEGFRTPYETYSTLTLGYLNYANL